MKYSDLDIYENDSFGKIEDAGVVIRGGGIDRYWSREGIENDFKKFFDIEPKHDWLFDSDKALAHFNLRSIEFGNWMSQQDRANFLYASMLSLHNFAKVLGIKDSLIGMKGKISIALGARGRGRAKAHYEPNPNAVINLTKTMGMGSLAHEYAHAVDNLISYHTKGSTQLWVTGGDTTRKGYNPRLAKSKNWFEAQFEEFFNRLYFKTNTEPTEFSDNLKGKGEYWRRRAEVFARTFEVYVYEALKKRKIKDHFLVASAYKTKVYPNAKLVKSVSPIITQVFKKAFEVIGKNKPLEGIEAIDIQGEITGYDGFQKTLKKNASIDDTLENMKRIALRDTYQVKSLATQLKANTVKETAQNIWNYLRRNTRYKLDKKGIEQLRTPARGLVDGNKGLTDRNFGIDCDDYTILISALLLNMGIDHEYRVTAYKEVGRFQHIYPVAFDSLGNEYIIDVVPEIPRFNYEAKPIIDIKKIPMELHELSGAIDTLDQNEITSDLLDDINAPFTLSGIEDDDDDDQDLESEFLSGFGEVEHPEDADIILNGTEDAANFIKGGLLAEIHKARKALLKEKQEPTALSQVVNVDREIAIMDNILKLWRDDQMLMSATQKAIVSGSSYTNFYKAILLSLEKLSAQDLRGLYGDMDEPIYLARVDMNDFSLAQLLEDENDDLDELDQLGSRRSRRRAKRRAKRKKRGGLFKRIFKGIGKGIKKVVKAVVRFNPATIVVRAAIRLVLKINLFKIASKLIYGYLTEAQAKAQHMDLNEWRKLVKAKNRGENFYKKLGGKTSKFKKAIIRGKAAKKTGLQLSGDLGAAATGTTTAAASGFLVFIKAILKKINFGALFKRKKTNNTGVTTTDDTANIQLKNDLPNDDTFAYKASSYDNSDTKDQGNTNKTFGQKVKDLFKKHKKKIYGVIIALVIIFVAVKFYNSQKLKKKRSLAGIKAARTRARNRRKTPSLKGVTPRALPPRRTRTTTTKAIAGVRKRKISNANRLKAMHRKAKQLQKDHPKTKYSTLLKRAAKMV